MIKKFIAYLDNNPDKKKHFKVGAVITLASTTICGMFIPPLYAIAIGVILANIAGVYKEVRDLITGLGNAEMLDFVATSLGGTVVGIPLVVCYYLVELVKSIF